MLRGKENRFPATGGLHRNGDYRGKYYSFGRNICSHCRPRRVHRQIRLSGGRRFWTPLRGATNLVHLSSRNVGRMELRETRAVVAAPPCTTPTWTVSDHPQHLFRATAVYMQLHGVIVLVSRLHGPGLGPGSRDSCPERHQSTRLPENGYIHGRPDSPP